MPSTLPTVIPVGSPTESGALDLGQATGSVALEMDASLGISATTLQPKAQEVVTLNNARAAFQIIQLLTGIERRLAHLEEVCGGIPIDT